MERMAGLEAQVGRLRDELEGERAAREAAERVSRSKDEFLALLSHELRTPLNAVLGWAQLLRSASLDDDQRKRGLQTIERQAKLQAQLVEKILDLSRILSGKLSLHLVETNLSEIAEGVAHLLEPEAMAKRITVEVQVVPGLQVSGDADRLQQVVCNLVTNAIRYTPPGGRIELSLSLVGGQVTLRVRDDGAGIAPGLLPLVFDRFFQAGSPDGAHRTGLGLGLTIARQIVDLHGGTITAESPGVGKGSRFTLRLPKLEHLVASAGAPGSPDERSTTVDRLDDVSVLIVEDEPDAREVLKMVLEERGAVVRVAGTAKSALAVAVLFSPHVIVSDLELPDESGRELLRKIRALGKEVPAVALSGHAGAHEVRLALDAGFQVHVPKPVEPGALVSTVARLTSAR
jgi:nitrogen-specific signal transduction histidine kinase/CheY-like chemotaxis protein